MIDQKAVKQHLIAAPQSINEGVALKIASQARETLPGALDLQLEGLHLRWQQTFEAKRLTLFEAEGRAAIQQGMTQKGLSTQAQRARQGRWSTHRQGRTMGQSMTPVAAKT